MKNAFLIAFTVLFACPAFADSQTRTSGFAYDSAGLLTKEVIEPDSSNFCLVTTYTYDSFGNKASATTRNCNGSSGEAAAPTGDPVFTSRTSSTSFAATTANPVAGQFPTASTNAVGHTETKEFDAKLGVITKLTGPNTLATQWTYDGFGRKTQETRADTTTTVWTYTACGICPTNGRYFVTETTSGAPQKRVYFDALNREIRSEVQGFDGVWVRKDTIYNAVGQISQVSKPYREGATPIWTTYLYDILGRVYQADEPAGPTGAVRTATSYNGLTTTITVSNAGASTNLPGGVVQTKTVVKNSQGQVIQVTTQ